NEVDSVTHDALRVDGDHGVPLALPRHTVDPGLHPPERRRLRSGLRPEPSFAGEPLVKGLAAPEEAHLGGFDQPVPAVVAAVDDVDLVRLLVPEDEEVVPDELELVDPLLRGYRVPPKIASS